MLYLSMVILSEAHCVTNRVIMHFLSSGVHHKTKDCEGSQVIQNVKDILLQARHSLYPKDLSVTPLFGKKKTKIPKGNGGWGDRRDRGLCTEMAKPLLSEAGVDQKLIDGQKWPPVANQPPHAQKNRKKKK